MTRCLSEAVNAEGSAALFSGTNSIEPGSSPRNKLLNTRIGKKELGAAAKCNVTGLATRELLPFNPLRSSCIVTLPLSTIIF